MGADKFGEVVSAALPNITGDVGRLSTSASTEATASHQGAADSALYLTGASGTNQGGGSGARPSGYYIILDASRANSIYGAADTVRPPSVACQYIIKF